MRETIFYIQIKGMDLPTRVVGAELVDNGSVFQIKDAGGEIVAGFKPTEVIGWAARPA